MAAKRELVHRQKVWLVSRRNKRCTRSSKTMGTVRPFDPGCLGAEFVEFDIWVYPKGNPHSVWLAYRRALLVRPVVVASRIFAHDSGATLACVIASLF